MAEGRISEKVRGKVAAFKAIAEKPLFRYVKEPEGGLEEYVNVLTMLLGAAAAKRMVIKYIRDYTPMYGDRFYRFASNRLSSALKALPDGRAVDIPFRMGSLDINGTSKVYNRLTDTDFAAKLRDLSAGRQVRVGPMTLDVAPRAGFGVMSLSDPKSPEDVQQLIGTLLGKDEHAFSKKLTDNIIDRVFGLFGKKEHADGLVDEMCADAVVDLMDAAWDAADAGGRPADMTPLLSALVEASLLGALPPLPKSADPRADDIMRALSLRLGSLSEGAAADDLRIFLPCGDVSPDIDRAAVEGVLRDVLAAYNVSLGGDMGAYAQPSGPDGSPVYGHSAAAAEAMPGDPFLPGEAAMDVLESAFSDAYGIDPESSEASELTGHFLMRFIRSLFKSLMSATMGSNEYKTIHTLVQGVNDTVAKAGAAQQELEDFLYERAALPGGKTALYVSEMCYAAPIFTAMKTDLMKLVVDVCVKEVKRMAANVATNFAKEQLDYYTAQIRSLLGGLL